MLLCNSVWTADTCLLANGGCFVTVDKQQVELCVMLPLSSFWVVVTLLWELAHQKLQHMHCM